MGLLEEMSKLEEKISNITGDFGEEIKDSLKKIRDIIEGTGVIDALEEHINAIKSLAFDFKDEENFENYKESLGNLVRALNNVPCEELISSIFSALLEIKDEVFGELMNILKIKTSLEKLLNSKGLISDSFNKLLEELEPEIKKLKINEKLAPINKNLEELREEIKQKLNASHITETIEQYIDGLKNLKDKMTVENIKKKIERGLYTCDTEFIWKLGKISEIETIVNNIIDDFEKSKIKNIIDNLQKEATEEIKALIDNMKPKIEKRKEKIQEKLKEYLNDPRFEPLVTNLKKFSDALEELKASFGKIKEMEKFKIFKEKIDKLKKVIKEIEQSMKIIQIKEIIYNLKNKIKNLDFKGKLNELNEAKDKFMEEWAKYRDLESTALKIEYIFNQEKEIGKKQLEKAKKLSEQIKNKINSLNIEKLKKIIDEIEIKSNGITEIINKIDINAKIEKAITYYGKFEEIFKNFDEKEEEKKYKESLNDLKNKVKAILNQNVELDYVSDTIFNYFEITNLTVQITEAIILEYLYNPDKKEDNEITENFNEIFKVQIEEFKKSAQEIIKGSKIEEIINENDTIIDKIKILPKTVEKIKELTKKYEDKSPEKIQKEIFEELKNSIIGKELKERYEKLKEKYEELYDIINQVDLAQLEEIKGKINDSEKIEKIGVYIGIIKALNETSDHTYYSDSFDKATKFIKNAIKNIDFAEIINITNEVQGMNGTTIEKENAEKMKKLMDEIQSMYDSLPLLNIFGHFIDKKKRFLSQKGIKKQKRKKRRMKERTGELLCKIDHKFSSAKQIIIEQENNLQSNILQQTTEFVFSNNEIK